MLNTPLPPVRREPLKVDAVVTNYNESIGKVNQTLAALLRQEYPFHKIFLVDDGSSRQPLNEAELIKDEKIELVKLNENVGIAAARNLGIALSEAPFVACINVEVLPDKNWLQTCLQSLANEQNGCVYGKLTPLEKTIFSSWRMRFHEVKFPNQSSVAAFAPGHAVLFRRQALDSVQGYNSKFKLVQEDSDICERMRQNGFETYYNNLALCTSVQDDTLQSLARKNMGRLVGNCLPQISLLKFSKLSFRFFLIRVGRNGVKFRLHFLPLDLAIFILEFYCFYQKKRRA